MKRLAVYTILSWSVLQIPGPTRLAAGPLAEPTFQRTQSPSTTVG